MDKIKVKATIRDRAGSFAAVPEKTIQSRILKVLNHNHQLHLVTLVPEKTIQSRILKEARYGRGVSGSGSSRENDPVEDTERPTPPEYGHRQRRSRENDPVEDTERQQGALGRVQVQGSRENDPVEDTERKIPRHSGYRHGQFQRKRSSRGY